MNDENGKVFEAVYESPLTSIETICIFTQGGEEGGQQVQVSLAFRFKNNMSFLLP